VLANADIARIINSNEIQSIVKTSVETASHERKKNPLTNNNALFKLNPAAKVAKL
jgi:large subunit ribosomal protein L4e